MKKLLLIAVLVIGTTGTVAAKSAVLKKGNKTVMNLKKSDVKKKVAKLNFPVTFCSDAGCETLEFDHTRYPMSDLMVWIDWFLRES